MQACSGCCTDVLFSVFGLTSCYTLRWRKVKPVDMNMIPVDPLRTAGGRGRGDIAYQRASCKVVLCVHRGGCRVRIFFYDTVGRYAVSTKGKNYFTLRFKARVCAPLPSAAHRRDRVGRRGTEGHGSVGQDVLDQISPEYTGASHFLLAPLSLVEQSSCSRCSRCSSQPWKSLSLGLPLSTKHSTGVPYFVFSAHNDNLECSPSP